MWGVDPNFCSGLQPCKDPTVGTPHRRHRSPAGMRDAHLRDRWLLSDSRETQVFILPRLFLFLSLLLNCSLAKGLINSYAGQLKHVGCDRFFSTDSEEVQKAAPNRGKDTFPLACWSLPQIDLNPQGVWCGQTELRQLGGGGGHIFWRRAAHFILTPTLALAGGSSV